MSSAAGLILAAGASSRMGRPKQLLPAGNVSLLDRIIREALHSDLDPVVLVLGHRAGEIRETLVTDLNHPKLRVLENKNYRHGISTSIVTGLLEVEMTCNHVMVLLADMPYITAGLINLLLQKYLDSGLPLGAIQLEGKRSHPVVIGRSLFPSLHQMRGDTGARNLFLQHADQICLVTPKGKYRDIDMDTPEDYKVFIESLEKDRNNE
ncbi:NTP transferase domain-containing protein [Thermodesulfobacteriota bacterium]